MCDKVSSSVPCPAGRDTAVDQASVLGVRDEAVTIGSGRSACGIVHSFGISMPGVASWDERCRFFHQEVEHVAVQFFVGSSPLCRGQ